MDSPDEIPRGDEGLGGFRMTLPENCVEYMLFLVDEGIPESHRLQNLEAIRKAAMKTVEELTKDYIWQREPFSLETKIENGMCPSLSFPPPLFIYLLTPVGANFLVVRISQARPIFTV